VRVYCKVNNSLSPLFFPDVVNEDCCNCGSSSVTTKKASIRGAGGGENGMRVNRASGSDFILRSEPADTAGRAAMAVMNFIVVCVFEKIYEVLL
jgi:hypothetical protein